MTANNSLVVSPGDDLYRVAAIYYGDAAYWSQIALANGLIDPVIQLGATLILPASNEGRAADGALINQ